MSSVYQVKVYDEGGVNPSTVTIDSEAGKVSIGSGISLIEFPGAGIKKCKRSLSELINQDLSDDEADPTCEVLDPTTKAVVMNATATKTVTAGPPASVAITSVKFGGTNGPVWSKAKVADLLTVFATYAEPQFPVQWPDP